MIIAYRLRESISFWNFIYLNSERKGLISKIDSVNKKLLFSGTWTNILFTFSPSGRIGSKCWTYLATYFETKEANFTLRREYLYELKFWKSSKFYFKIALNFWPHWVLWLFFGLVLNFQRKVFSSLKNANFSAFGKQNFPKFWRNLRI